MEGGGKFSGKRVKLDDLIRGSPRPVDQLGFHNFIRNHAFRKKMYSAFCMLLEEKEGIAVLEAFRAIVEKRMGQPWTPEYAGGMTMALIASVNKYDGNIDHDYNRAIGLPRKALDEGFITSFKKSANELCNSYAVYSLAVVEHWAFMNKIMEIGKGMDTVTEKELAGILRAGLAQYAHRNQY